MGLDSFIRSDKLKYQYINNKKRGGFDTDTRKIISVVEMYEEKLYKAGVPKIRMDTKRTFASLNKEEMLAHAYFLIDGVKESAKEDKLGKMNRHLSSIQMCLSFAGWYTLEDLMNHNKP